MERLAHRLTTIAAAPIGGVRRRLIERAVAADARVILARLESGGDRRGLLIDCGSNVGQGATFFQRHFPTDRFDLVLIEPNPYCLPHLRRLADRGPAGRIEVIPAAASTHEGVAIFYGPLDPRGTASLGGSILSEHNSRYYDSSETETVEVPTFSLAALIAARAPHYAAVVMKVDIEGAEYDVLEDLIAHNVHRSLDAIYVEFHSQYMREPERSVFRKREARIVDAAKRDGVRFRLWD